MTPLRVQAILDGPVYVPGQPPALDALLAAAVAMRDGLPPPSVGGVTPIEVPIQRSPCGRFHLATVAHYRVEARELRHTNRRFPIAEAQALGNRKLRRISLSGGPTRSYRIPYDVKYLSGDTMTWWCIGNGEEVSKLLEYIQYIGKKRSVGCGRVRAWSVHPCEPWGPGFPVVRDGRPLRPLPLDWPGLDADAERAMAVLTYPYWERHREEMLAVPDWYA